MDGSVWSEGNYKEGKKHGEFIYYGIGNKNIYSKKKVENYKNGILEGKLLASPNQPAWKPAIILNNIRIVNPKVMINKQMLKPGKDFKYGIVKELNQWKTIIWIDAIFDENIDFLIQ